MRASPGSTERLAEAGTSVSEWLECRWSLDAAYDVVAPWLAAGGRPQVVVCLNDRIAWGVYHALADIPLIVPDDVSVVSFDGSELGRWMRPTLASVALPFFEMGEEAVRILLDPSDDRVGGHGDAAAARGLVEVLLTGVTRRLTLPIA